MLKMAAVSDCFSIGSVVACKTCFDQNVEGEVLAFDQQKKMLILKCRSKQKDKHDVYVINLEFCSEVQVKKEANEITQPPQLPIIRSLQTKLSKTMEQRQKWMSSINSAVSPEAQNLYRACAKTLDSNVAWQGLNIVIFKEVIISPPYRVENVTSTNPNAETLLNYVRKQVDNHFKNQTSSAPDNASLADSPTSVTPIETTSNIISTTGSTGSATTAAGTVATSSTSASPVPAN